MGRVGRGMIPGVQSDQLLVIIGYEVNFFFKFSLPNLSKLSARFWAKNRPKIKLKHFSIYFDRKAELKCYRFDIYNSSKSNEWSQS